MVVELQDLSSLAASMAASMEAGTVSTKLDAAIQTNFHACREKLLTGFHDFAPWSIPYMYEQVINPTQSCIARFYPTHPYDSSSAKLDLRLDIVLNRLRDNAQGVIVVENANIDSLSALAGRYQIPLSFYNRHMGPFFSDQLSIAARKRSHDIHLDFRIHENETWMASSAELFGKTIKYGFRISCRELRAGLYLVLLSAVSNNSLAVETEAINARISPVGTPSIQGIGVIVRSFFKNSAQGVLEGLLGSFFRDGQGANYLSLLQQNKYDDTSKIFCWLLALQAWTLNLEIIGTDIRRHSYRASHSPDESNFYRLAVHRRTIAGLRNEIAGHEKDRKMIMRPFDSNLACWRKQASCSTDSLETKTATEQIQGIEDRIAQLGTVMNEVNSFLTACINLRDSDIMKTQARRATELTALAVIYLPLTLVTGIFGMNLGEINGGYPKWWTSIIALVILGAATVVPFGAWIFLRRRHENLDRAKQMEGLV